MLKRFYEIAEIWEGDHTEYLQGSPAWGWWGFRLRVKCSICILFGWKAKRDSYDLVPVWIGPMYVNYTDPSASWSEVGVTLGWSKWKYRRYSNGI